MPDNMAVPAGFILRYDNQTGDPLLIRQTRYAGFIRRLAAYLVDGLIIGSLWGLCITVPYLGSLFKYAPFFADKVFFTYTAAALLRILVFSAYFILFTKLCGATPGKMLLRLKVVDELGNAPSWTAVIYRETVGRFLSSIMCIGYLVLAFDKKHRGFHDMLSDTYVVYAD